MPASSKIGVDDFIVKFGREAFASLPRVPFQIGLVWPAWVMSGAAGKFAQTYGEYLEPSPAFFYTSYLTLLGHLLSDKITLDSELRPQPRLYTVLLGESADDRKSTAMNHVTRFFSETIDQSDIHLVLGVGSAEGLAKAFNADKPRVLLVLDELKALIQKCKIDGSVLLPCINTLFEANRFHSLTKNHDIKIDNAQLCFLAASTLDTYANMFTGQFLDIGFLNRLFIVIGSAERRFSIPKLIPQDVKAPLRGDLLDVLGHVAKLTADGPYAFSLTPQARNIFDSWYFGQERSVFTKRLDTYGHRLMPLLAVNELKLEIDPGIAQKVVALLTYQLEARRQADPIDADNAVARVEEKMRRLLGPAPLGKRELERRGHKTRVGTWTWNAALQNLIRNREVIFDQKANLYSLGK
jgi:hypothetical protein